MSGETDYHVAITRIARPGKEADFEAALHDFAHDSLAFPGTLASTSSVPQTIKPPVSLAYCVHSPVVRMPMRFTIRDFFKPGLQIL